MFTYNQFGSSPLTLLNETVWISKEEIILKQEHDKVFDSGLLLKWNIFQ